MAGFGDQSSHGCSIVLIVREKSNSPTALKAQLDYM